MKSALIKLLLTVSISTMVALAILGTYVVATKSNEISIVKPADPIKALPSQMPPRQPSKRYIRPQDQNPDAPSPH
ncbi:MAG: hypothetical protein QOJ65_1318 [Fimbriimonadaceae bacterium]|jgi:hypothetical protein|nr:hypothetical protein [Fimbriimonadaceae bacterium]